MTNLLIKRHKVQLNGCLITGDTYPVKSWIKEYLCGKWDAERKGWIVDLKQVETWTGTCIQPDNTTTEAGKTTKRDDWYVNTKYGRELGEDY